MGHADEDGLDDAIAAASARRSPMIIVAGSLDVDPAEREAYLKSCVDVVTAARAAEGCVDFAISADLVDPGRINIYEQWVSVDAVEHFRDSGPSDEQSGQILGGTAAQHVVASSETLL